MKNVSVEVKFPMVFVNINDNTNLVISHVLSTITTIAAITLMPWAMPILMAQVQRSWV